MYRNGQRGYNGGNEFCAEAMTPPVNSQSLGQRKIGEEQVSPGEFSPELLDLNSLDTKLLHEMGRSRGLPENNVLRKSFVADKEKASSVTKIKVVVRKRPLNKKELAKNEEDIIDTHSNSVTVHETKLKEDGACSFSQLFHAQRDTVVNGQTENTNFSSLLSTLENQSNSDLVENRDASSKCWKKRDFESTCGGHSSTFPKSCCCIWTFEEKQVLLSEGSGHDEKSDMSSPKLHDPLSGGDAQEEMWLSFVHTFMFMMMAVLSA